MNRQTRRMFEAALDPSARPASWMVALLPRDTEPPGVTEVLGCLDGSDLAVADRRVAAEQEVVEARWELEVDVETGADRATQPFRVWLEPSETFEDAHLEWGHLTNEDIDEARQSRWSIGVSTRFGDNVLEDYHRQIKVLAASAPRPVAFYDISAGWPRPGPWLGETARSAVPPSPDNLYCVHVVFDENARDGRVWLHTHGLMRCGSIEFEMMDVPKDHAATLCTVINATAALSMEHGPPPPNEPFLVGQDLVLAWLPWQSGIGRARRKALGNKSDRDEFHSGASGILFVPMGKRFGIFGSRYASCEQYLPILDDNPLLYVSNMETDRMRRLATERLERFLDLQKRCGSNDEWAFLVKLGYVVDEADSLEEREHLWFQVRRVVRTGRDVKVDAVLLNRPYSVARMKEGQRDIHSLELLSDWAILSPRGRFDPDTVLHLERDLARDGDGAEAVAGADTGAEAGTGAETGTEHVD